MTGPYVVGIFLLRLKVRHLIVQYRVYSRDNNTVSLEKTELLSTVRVGERLILYPREGDPHRSPTITSTRTPMELDPLQLMLVVVNHHSNTRIIITHEGLTNLTHPNRGWTITSGTH
jgi:hypothetical protein